MDKEYLQQISFQIVGYAGNALSLYFEALNKVKEGKYEESDKLLAEADEQMHFAHNMQTELITKEAQGQDMEFSIIVVHAQDHLMNTILTKKLVEELIYLNKEKQNVVKS